MAEKKKTAIAEGTAEKTESDMEMVFVPREKGEKPGSGKWVCVNGKPYLIKKGENVMVPKAVAEVIRHANAARDKADEYKANAAKA